jgi:hypothetical protein
MIHAKVARRMILIKIGPKNPRTGKKEQPLAHFLMNKPLKPGKGKRFQARKMAKKPIFIKSHRILIGKIVKFKK